MVSCQQIAVPSNGTSVTVFQTMPADECSISIRNTGLVTVLLGPAGNEYFPLDENELIGVSVQPDDTLLVAVQTTGQVGQLTVLAMN